MFHKSLKKHKAFLIPAIAIGVTLLIAGIFLLPKTNTIPQEDFDAPTMTWDSPKKVEDYFVANLHMTPEDLRRQEGRTKVSFYVTEGTTLDAIISNLAYYGLVRKEDALRYALLNTKDTNGGKEDAIQVGNTGTIDKKAFYTISETMTAWEIADTLLNKPNFYGSHGDYGYLFMP